MTAGLGTGSWSATSHGSDPPGIFKARIEAIDDPKKRNRVQVRIFGYQDDQGNIPKSALEWIHVLSHDSQIPGATSTHNYYPGAEVWVMNTGTEKFVMGSSAGFDGESRLQNNPWGADSSSNQHPDQPNIVRGQSDTVPRTSGQGLMGATSQPQGANSYFQYQNFNNAVKLFAYATGKGASPAPFGKGDVSKQDTLKTIGLLKSIVGSDVLNIINALDGNASGSVKAALQIILNLRNGGFGNAMNLIGSGSFNAALTQYSNQYGAYTQNSLVNLLTSLIQYIAIVQAMNIQNFQTNVSNGVILQIVALLSNTTFAVSTDVLNDMTNINNTVTLAAGNGPVAFYQTLLTAFDLDFTHAVQQAFTSIIAQVNQLAISFPNIADFITLFGGTVSFINFAQLLAQVAVYVGVPPAAVNTIGANTIGLALGGGLNMLPNIQPVGPSNSSPNSNLNPLIGLLAVFIGNPIAKAELLGGGLIKTFLTGNVIKYRQNPRNDGPGVLKTFSS